MQPFSPLCSYSCTAPISHPNRLGLIAVSCAVPHNVSPFTTPTPSSAPAPQCPTGLTCVVAVSAAQSPASAHPPHGGPEWRTGHVHAALPPSAAHSPYRGERGEGQRDQGLYTTHVLKLYMTAATGELNVYREWVKQAGGSDQVVRLTARSGVRGHTLADMRACDACTPTPPTILRRPGLPPHAAPMRPGAPPAGP